MIYFTAHTFKCVCPCRRAMFRVLGMYNFDVGMVCTLIIDVQYIGMSHVLGLDLGS